MKEIGVSSGSRKDVDQRHIYKARGENILRSRERKNWTVVRPSITYSLLRYQLVTLEASDTVGRALAGKKTVLPEPARHVQGTMSWAGDVALMLAKLLFNDNALGEDFNVCTAEHHSWEEIAAYYADICNLKAVWVDTEDYLKIVNPGPLGFNNRWQLECDRYFDRIMDNSKVLAATGLQQESLMKLRDGLEKEIARCPRDFPWRVNTAMDEYLARHP